MSQLKYMHFGLISVLAFGLVSCAKDKNKTSDVYRPPAVTIVRPHDAVHALEANPTVLDVQDILSFGPTLPQRYQVEAICASGALIYRHTFNADGRTPAKLFNILPPEVLTLDYAQAHPTCSLIVTEWNELGSSFRQADLVGRAIIDERPHSVLLKGDLQWQHKLGQFIRIENRKDLTAFYDNDHEAKMQLVCAQAKSAASSFNHSFSLGDIDLAQMTYADQLEVRINLPPRQRCRMMVLQNEQFVAASEIFTTVFPLAEGELKPVDNVPTAQNIALFEDGRDVPFGYYTFTNPTSFEREIRVPINFPVVGEFFYASTGDIYGSPYAFRSRSQLTAPLGYVRLARTVNNSIEFMYPTRDASSRRYTILPFETVMIQVFVEGSNHYGCTTFTSDVPMSPNNIIVSMPDALTFEIEDELGEPKTLNPPKLSHILLQRGNIAQENELHAEYAQIQFEISCRRLPHE